MKEHVSKRSKKVTEKQCNNVTRRKRKGKQVAEKKKAKLTVDDSQHPGPSVKHLVCNSEDSEVESQSESEFTEEEKLCVCGKFVPDTERECVSLIFTK